MHLKRTLELRTNQIRAFHENHMLIIKLNMRVLHVRSFHQLVSFHVACQKITLEEFSDSKSAADEKSVRSAEHSVNSLATATHETSNVAVYEVKHCT